MTEQETIYQEVCDLLTKLFEIDPQDITPEARLYEDRNWTALTRWT